MTAETYIRAEVTYLHSTADAVRIEWDDGASAEWVPRSVLSWRCDQAIDEFHRGDSFQIEVAEWKALQIGLTY